MRYEMNFGKLGKSLGEVKPGGRFRIALLGDFSGRANKGELETGADLAKRKGLKVEFDTIDDVIQRLGIKLDIPLGNNGGTAEVSIASLDDFHPDELYDNIEIFEELSGLRSRLNNSSTFESAASEIQEWLGDKSLTKRTKLKAKSKGTDMPSGKLSDFSKLMGQAASTNAGGHSVEELLKRVVAPFVVPSKDPAQDEMVASVDESLSGLMRSILHDPDFRTLEAMWRSVDLLARSLETGVDLQIILYDITAEEIAADLSGADDLTETGLYQLLVEQPTMDAQQGAFSVVAGCYTFEQTPPHAELLGRIAQIVAQTKTSFIASIGNEALKKLKPEDVHPLVADSWDALKAMPEASYLALVAPRFMVRNPYGKKSDPIDPFEFEEFNAKDGLRSLLWGNPAMLVALLLGLNYAKAGGLKGMNLSKVMSLGEMPFHYFNDADGDQIALPCTDRMLPMKLAEQVTLQSIMPLLAIKGQPEVRLGSWTSLGEGDLAGPWAPREHVAAEDAAVAEEAAAAEPEPDADDDDDSDDLADDSDDGGDDELDALLASLDSDDDDDEDSDDADDEDDDEEMDHELAALLADL
ncbi:MAG: type VI secretion system contractile sheath large subunit [Planctomycetota bacterium]|nr:type VI secretion system contractile sheath large subunit [Planctomycetota bacterium]